MNKCLFLFLFFIFSCTPKKETITESSEIFNTNENKVTFLGDFYFDFDKVDYFSIDIDEEKVWNLWSNKHRTSKEELLSKIIGNYDFPKSIFDVDFLSNIESIGYTKFILDESKYNTVKSIFRFKKNTIIDSFACPAIYRDILVFKKNKKIIGIAKICFGCRHHHILGSKLNTDQFGQGGDYEKLYKLLYNKEMSY
jgi:hypothetical protein